MSGTPEEDTLEAAMRRRYGTSATPSPSRSDDNLEAAIRRRYGSKSAPQAAAPPRGPTREGQGDSPESGEDTLEAAMRRRYGNLDAQTIASLPKMAEVATEAARTVDLDLARRAKQDISQRFQDPRIRRDNQRRVDSVVPTLRAAERAHRMVERLAVRSGDPDLLAEVKGFTKDAVKAAGRVGLGGLQGALTVVDTPGRLARNAIGAMASERRDFEPLEAVLDRRGSPSEVVADVEAGRREGSVLGTGADLLLEGLGHTAGYVGGALGAGLGWLADSALGPDPNVTAEQRAEAAKAAFGEAPKTTKEAIAGLVFDPLTYVGAGGGAKGAAGIAGKQFLRAGQGFIAAERLGQAEMAAAKLVGRLGGTERLGPALAKLGKAYGVPAEQMARVFGEGGRYAGRGQMTAGLPMFSEKLTGEVVGPLDAALSSVSGGKLRSPEQVFRKGVDAIKNTYRGARGLPPDLGYHTNLAIAREAAKARNLALQNTAEELERFRTEVSSLAPPDPVRREAIVRQVVDPDYEARVVAAVPPEAKGWRREQLEGWVEGWKKFLQPGESHLRLTKNDAGERVLVGVRPVEAAPALNLTDRERTFVDALQNYFERQRNGLVTAGLLDEAQQGRNLLTGRYIPRMYKGGIEGFGGLAEAAQQGAPRGSSALKSRGAFGGRALGKVTGQGLEATFDPFEIVTKYQPKVERAKQTAGFKQWAAERFGTPAGSTELHPLAMQRSHELVKAGDGSQRWVPKETMAALDRQFASVSGPKSLPAKAAAWMTSRFKGLNTVGVPRYVVRNVFGDAMMMGAAGFRNPRWLERARALRETAPDAILVAGPARDYSAAEVKGYLKQAGILKGSMTSAPFEIEPARGLGRSRIAMQETAEKAARSAGDLVDSPIQRAGKWAGRRKLDLYEDAASLGFKRLGQKASEWWDEHAKAAFFMDRLAKGDAPNVAAQRTVEVLFDYADQGKALRFASKFMAFPTWSAKAAVAIPKLSAQAPYVFPLTNAAITGLGAGEADIQDQAPKFARERTITMPLSTQQRSVARRVLGRFGADIDPGYGMGIQVPTPFAEGVSPLLELAGGNPDPVLSGLTPLATPIVEYLTRQDYLTKRPMERPSLSSMFPMGTPGVPPAFETRSHPEAPVQQMPWLSRNLPAFVLTPQAIWGANKALGGQFLGRHRPLAPDFKDRQAISLLGLSLGLPMFLTSPADQVQEMAHDPDVFKAAQMKGQVKRSKKKARAIAR